MNLRQLTPRLYTDNMPRSLAFYTTQLDLLCDAIDVESGWASLRRGAIHLMLSAPHEHASFGGRPFTGALYFYVEGIDDWWERLRTRVPVAYELASFDHGMREFAVYDPDGYLVQLGEEIEV